MIDPKKILIRTMPIGSVLKVPEEVSYIAFSLLTTQSAGGCGGLLSNRRFVCFIIIIFNKKHTPFIIMPQRWEGVKLVTSHTGVKFLNY